jgi:hypothetical protein
LPVNAVRHFGHDAPPHQLLLRRWRTGYLCGLGELLRASAGQPRLRLALRELRELRIYLAALLGWLLLLSLPLWPLPAVVRLEGLGALIAVPLLLMAWRKRSVTKALYSLASWSLNAAALVRGLAQSRRSATEPIASRVIKEPADFHSRPAQRFSPPASC